MGIAQQGQPRPHNVEWEIKRIAAVREWASKTIYPKGYKRSVEVMAPALAALKKWKAEHPEEARKHAIANLPKHVSGPANGNWKGGKTKAIKAFHVANGPALRIWRKAVMERCNNTCQECGATGKLDAHHIIPLAETRAFAFDRANGVALCRKCHAKTDSYANPKQKRFRPSQWGFLARVIPHAWQDYATVGNYFQNSTQVGFLISSMSNEKYESLVLIHELIEWLICKLTGVKMKAIDKFDMEYEQAREGCVKVQGRWQGIPKTSRGKGALAPCGCQFYEEPGDDPHSPYHEAHMTATLCEEAIARAIGVDWQAYGDTVAKL